MSTLSKITNHFRRLHKSNVFEKFYHYRINNALTYVHNKNPSYYGDNPIDLMNDTKHHVEYRYSHFFNNDHINNQLYLKKWNKNMFEKEPKDRNFYYGLFGSSIILGGVFGGGPISFLISSGLELYGLYGFNAIRKDYISNKICNEMERNSFIFTDMELEIS